MISFQYTGWRTAAEHEAERAAATRASLLDRLTADRLRIIGFHLPYPGIGQVERRDSGYRFVVG